MDAQQLVFRYGNRKRTQDHTTVEVGVWRIPVDVQKKAMGIDWMTLTELSQAIPPAYTEHIGRQLMTVLTKQEERYPR